MYERPDIIAAKVAWGEAVKGNAAEILADAEAQQDDEKLTGISEAKEFLLGALAGGKRPATVCAIEGKKAGISAHTLRRAKDAMEVVSTKNEFGGGWCWSLSKGTVTKMPTKPQDGIASESQKDAIFDESGHLRSESEAVEDDDPADPDP